MKTRLLISFLLTSNFLFSQDTTVTWIQYIDTLTYELFYDKKEIPVDFYPLIHSSFKDIASAKEDFQIGCTVTKKGLPHKRLNWIAKDKNNHWVLSVSYGGLAYGTNYYYFNNENAHLNVNCVSFFGSSDVDELTFGKTVIKYKSGKFYRIEIKPLAVTDEK